MKKILIFLIVSLFVVAPVYAIKKNKLLVYPNPWIPESGKSLNTQRGDEMKHGAYTSDGWIKFEGVNQGHETNCSGDLRIYDVAGRLIRSKDWTLENESKIPLPQHCREGRAPTDEGSHPKDLRNHIVHWDGKDNSGNYVESGVYIWIIRESNGSKYNGKVVVVR